ncbi:Hsp70 family protein [Thalassoroseus pseudoceratinae]|uniref:Hsp70 family protein n=1 Tax=Thalassoroseus pseudoceratinae TaxID=2713176 RepID=UPI0014242977|nr:Hsp70 family protein [Thalassoroseus pseudoceratinae]
MSPTEDQPTGPRFVVGIDLGTTNSAVAYVDVEESNWSIQTFEIPQLVAAGEVESHGTLPSFHYEATAEELSSESLRLPWNQETDSRWFVGVFAREQGRMVPGRAIASAKSWLCHSGVDRTADLLPWHGATDVEKLSPVAVSARFLQHIRSAWDRRFPEHPLAEQEIVLTLPASFDEVARELTVQAGRQAGLPRLVLIEEPQAAFYSWINRHRADWDQLVTPGQRILVCDIGGGTSDFTLIQVRRASADDQQDAQVAFHRIAVGEHLILGGDNLDLALAHHLEQKLTPNGKLEPRQWSVLVRQCRQVKEDLLKDDAPEKVTVTLPGSGSRLIGSGLQAEITRDEALEILQSGFLPTVELETQPQSRQSGFQEFGLPYAQDAAITRYLAAFLTAHRDVSIDDSDIPTDHDPARPDIILFNGGFFASTVLRQRLIDQVTNWFSTDDADWSPIVLQNDRLDLAVAHGAAYYGMVRRGEGVRIAAGLARTYYVGIEDAHGNQQAMCLLPAGIEAGEDVEIAEPSFLLQLSEPIEFPLFVSSTRLTDRPGEIVPIDPEQMRALPPIRTVLKSRGQATSEPIPVELVGKLTEVGTMELWCRQTNGSRSWQLQFDVRTATQTDIAAHESAAEAEGILSETDRKDADEVIEGTFGKSSTVKPSRMMKDIARRMSLSRSEFPSSLLRSMWETLMDHESGRRRSPQHEARWLNAIGFCLRPGYGFALDDWRVLETWKTLQGKLVHADPQCRAEWWVLWRRLGGGLSAGQQTALATPLLSSIRPLHKQMTSGRGKGGAGLTDNSHEQSEIWRMLGSFELLKVPVRIELGRILLDLYDRPKMQPVQDALLWALGRVGQRVPLYGPLNSVLPPEIVAGWVEKLLDKPKPGSLGLLAVMLLARRTDDRFRDLPAALRDRVSVWLETEDAPPHWVQLVREGGEFDQTEEGQIFGESLPPGLRLQK